MTNEASITPLLRAIRSGITAQRAARRDRNRLVAELAQYATLAERAELEAIMDRHRPEETVELRAILGRLPLAG